MKSISEANIEILNQLKSVLVQFDNLGYKKSLKILNDISIGQHARHIIEFYQCLFNGNANGKINYDSRNRDLRIESDLEYALNNINILVEQLGASYADLSISLEVSIGFGNHTTVTTTFQRELTYLIEHTIHHLAIINIAINELFPLINVPKHFGVAFSTIQFQHNQNLTA
jgi:hypothetical protein